MLIPCEALPVRIGVGEVSGAAPRTQRPSLAAGSFRLTRGWCGERGAGWARSGLAIPCDALPVRIGVGEASGAAPRTHVRPSLAAGSFRLARGWCGERGAGWARSGLAIPCVALPVRFGLSEVILGSATHERGERMF